MKGNVVAGAMRCLALRGSQALVFALVFAVSAVRAGAESRATLTVEDLEAEESRLSLADAKSEVPDLEVATGLPRLLFFPALQGGYPY